MAPLPHRVRTHPPWRSAGDDRGFSLIELSVALMLSSMLLVAFAGTLGSSLDASRGTRYRQTATATAMERVETARTIRWEYLGMPSVDPEAPFTHDGTLLGAAAGLDGDEALLLCQAGLLDARLVETIDGVEFTIWTYVTQIDPGLRRVMVLVEWLEEGVPLSYRSDTLVSSVSAGRAVTNFRPMFPDAAIVAVEDIDLHPGSTLSDPQTAHSASVLTNGDFGGGTAVIDGDVIAGATAIVDPTNVAGVVEQNAGTPVSPPNGPEIEAWRSGLRSLAQTGSVLSGAVHLADTTVAAPLYVNGSLVLEGTVTITGSGPVYATSSIRLQGGPAVTADSAVLVSDTQIEFSAGSRFSVSDPSYAGVIAFGTSAYALRLTGGADGSIQGIGYAPYGGITLSGAPAWHGSLVAHGGSSGYVDVSGGASVTYPAGMLPTSSLLVGLRPETSVIPGGC